MAKSTGSPFSLLQLFHFNPFSLGMGRDDHLCNPVSILDDLIFRREVDQDHFHLPPVISIDSSRCVKQCNPSLNS